MRRILIVGNSGGGKSTLARGLGARLRLPVIHLDALFWKPGWVESDKTEFRAVVARALTGKAWICDGNFSSNWDLTMPLADTVIWIDQPRLLCLARAIWRALTQFGRARADLAPGCPEKLDLKFYLYILGYDARSKPRLLKALAEHGAHARLVHLRSDRDIARFLGGLGP